MTDKDTGAAGAQAPHDGPQASLIEQALARQAAAPAPRRIDYDRMRRVGPAQKAALTRAIKTRDPEKIAAVCKAAVTEWNEIGAWPDHWSRWQRALDDALPWNVSVDIAEL